MQGALPEVCDYRDNFYYNYLYSLDECRDFTYFNFRGIRTCFLLSGCNDKRPRCTVPTSCVSGRKDCADGHFCSKLSQKPGEDIAWRCQGGINPYKEDIPSETPCYT